MWFGRKAKRDPASVTRELRDKALSIRASEIGLTGAAATQVWGALMETVQRDAVASLAAFADGTTSLYFSTGGGVLGAGENASVRTVSAGFLASAHAGLASFSPATATPLPETGRVRFYARSSNALLTADADEREVGHGRHPLSALYEAGQKVIAQIRLSSEQAYGTPEQKEFRRQIVSVANGIATLRRLATQRTAYRAPGPLDVIATDVQVALDAATREIEGQGMTVLGDQMEIQPDGGAVGPGRWFIDANATLCGRYSAIPGKATGALKQAMMLFSENDRGEFFLTGRGAGGASLATPPDHMREYLDWDVGLGGALARHRQGTGKAARAGSLRRIERLDDALDLVSRLRKSQADWRTLQDAEFLLDQDVRSMLGDRYEDLGAGVIEILSHDHA